MAKVLDNNGANAWIFRAADGRDLTVGATHVVLEPSECTVVVTVDASGRPQTKTICAGPPPCKKKPSCGGSCNGTCNSCSGRRRPNSGPLDPGERPESPWT